MKCTKFLGINMMSEKKKRNLPWLVVQGYIWEHLSPRQIRDKKEQCWVASLIDSDCFYVDFPGAEAWAVPYLSFAQTQPMHSSHTECFPEERGIDKQQNYSHNDQFVECIYHVKANLFGLIKRINSRNQDESIE